MPLSQITPCLWFDGQAEEAARFYVSIFPNSKITAIQRYTEAGKVYHGREAGSVMVVEFELNGQTFTGLNGGPQFKFTGAISFQVDCEDQDEVDHYWNHLKDGGDETKQQCGWVTDKFGLTWQIIPRRLKEMLSDSDLERKSRVTNEMIKMKKLDELSSSSTGWKNTLEHAFDGLYDIKVYEGSVYYNGTSAVDVGDTVSQDALFINDSLQTSSEIRPSEPNIDLPPALIVSATWHRTIEPVEPGEQKDITSTSMSLRAPNVMRWTRLKDECLEVLNTSPAALASDKVLWQHIQLQHITEEFAMQLSAKETSPDRSRAVQTQLAHREFKRQLDEWRRGVADGCWDEPLTRILCLSLAPLLGTDFSTAMPRGIPNIEQMDDNACMGLDWSEVPDMAFDLSNLTRQSRQSRSRIPALIQMQ
ncbi:hypothetical protein EMGR_003727 [Emarellia grisea]